MYTKVVVIVVTLFTAMGAAQTGGDANVDRVFHLTYTESAQAQREMATAIRSVTDTPSMLLDEAQRAWNVRGTAAQLAAVGWLIGELDKATGQSGEGGYWHQYTMPVGDEVVRVFYLKNPELGGQFQELATLVRSLADARRLYTYSTLRAITVRAPVDQMALVEWLVQQLDKPTDPQSLAQQDSSPREYQLAVGDDPVVRLFYLPHAGTVAQFQKIVTEVRTTTQIRRAYTYNAPRAVVFRGTVAQIAAVDRMIQERNK